MQEAIKHALREVHASGLPPAHVLHAFFARAAAGRLPPGAAAALMSGHRGVWSMKQGGEGSSREGGSEDEQEVAVEEEEEEEAGAQQDPYLCPPAVTEAVRGHLVFVEVPALPRG